VEMWSPGSPKIHFPAAGSKDWHSPRDERRLLGFRAAGLDQRGRIGDTIPMPGFISHSRGDGCPIIDLWVAFPAGRWAGCGERPTMMVRGLIDTGATHVVLNPPIVQQLGLPPIGSIEQTVVGGEVIVSPTFGCDVIFKGMRSMMPNSEYAFTVNDALALETPVSGYDAVIGWDVMGGMDLTFRRDNSFSLHFP
jgi:hypothetical protein